MIVYEIVGHGLPVVSDGICQRMRPLAESSGSQIEVKVYENHLGVVWHGVEALHKGPQIRHTVLNVSSSQLFGLFGADNIVAASDDAMRIPEVMLQRVPDGIGVYAVSPQYGVSALAFQVETNGCRPDATRVLVGPRPKSFVSDDPVCRFLQVHGSIDCTTELF